MLDFAVTTQRNRQIERMLAFKDGAETVQFDYNPWSVDNGNVTVVTWTVKVGNAAISAQALAAGIASALVTTAESGGSLVQIKATAGTNIHITNLDILAKDPNRPINDYGLCR